MISANAVEEVLEVIVHELNKSLWSEGEHCVNTSPCMWDARCIN